MRKLMTTTLMIAMLASPLAAQRLPAPPVMSAPAQPTGWSGGPVAAPLPRAPGPRWGGTVEGRWWGGMRAPGGWHAYRRPARGFVVPGYWLAPDFVIADFAEFGLDNPPYGYHWVRYYDDAVLIDDSGHVWDSVHGLDWDRLDRGSAQARYDDGYRYDYRAERGADYPPPPPTAPIRTYSGSSGGYTQTFVAGGGGSYVLPAGVTTITIESAPVVTTTTTTTDYYETYRRRAVRHVYRAHPVARHCCCRRSRSAILGS